MLGEGDAWPRQFAPDVHDVSSEESVCLMSV